METSFTWFPKMTRVMSTLPGEYVAEFALAVVSYGTYGEEPSFSSPLLAAVFEGLREDIDNSVNARTKNRGGRPRKTGVSEVSETENGGFEDEKPTETGVSEVSETPKRGFQEVSESENPSYINQTIPSHTNPNQTIGSGGGETPPKRRAFKPPTVEEVRGYAEANGLHRLAQEAEAFVDHYAANGWKVGGKAPMKDWKAAGRNWNRNTFGSSPQRTEAKAYAGYDSGF